jgi:hypothetical protein
MEQINNLSNFILLWLRINAWIAGIARVVTLAVQKAETFDDALMRHGLKGFEGESVLLALDTSLLGVSST